MKKTIAAFLTALLLLPACAFNRVGVHNQSTNISDEMEAHSALIRSKFHLVLHDEETGKDKEFTGWGNCSGVYVKDNIVLSAAHCVDTSREKGMTLKEIWVKRGDGDETARAVVVKIDPQADLVLLYTPLQGKPIKFADGATRGQDIWVVGNPLGLRDILTKGIVSQVDVSPEKEKATFLIIDAVVLPGNSGGPIVDANCRLVGILTRSTSLMGGWGASGLGIAVDIDTIQDFLKHK